jgi:hypothetical protein
LNPSDDTLLSDVEEDAIDDRDNDDNRKEDMEDLTKD